MPLTYDALQTGPDTQERVNRLIQKYREKVVEVLQPIVSIYYPSLLANPENEYRKMIELSTKMTLVGHACAETAGQLFDDRRQRIASLFGGCCFLADSFLDDFGEAASREYLRRLELLLTQGWFDIRTERERLFYIIISRLFAQRDVLEPTLRQAILRLFEAQKRDVEMRFDGNGLYALPRRRRLEVLKTCARDRSGHAIIVLAAFLAPHLTMAYCASIYIAGALIMHIDDHGDCYADLRDRRITYMNQVRDPERALSRTYRSSMRRLVEGLPAGSGRDLLTGFLTRYYLTRIEKHRVERKRGSSPWAVYE